MIFSTMCASKSFKYLLVLAVLVSSAFSAPVGEIQDTKTSGDAAATQVVQQDEDLQDLMNLVNKQAHRNNVMVHKQEMTHVENKDGQTEQVKETEEKVIDTNTGDVIADVKQEVKQESSGQEGEAPETVVETNVDIPSESVHETIVQDEEADQGFQGGVLVGDLTPADMAEFLYATQQFDLFYTALEKLVNQSQMTREEATEYARIVALEYERLQVEQPMLDSMYDGPVVAERSMPEEDSPYPMEAPIEYGVPQWPSYPFMEDAPEAYMTPEEKYIALLQQQQQQLMQQQQQQEVYGDINPYDFLTALWEEAYGKGNEEAQEIVQMLYDRVSTDDNNDDIGQIRNILLDSVASSLGEDEMGYDESGPAEQLVPQENFQPQVPSMPEQSAPEVNDDQSEADQEGPKTEDGQSEAAEGEKEEAKEESEAEETKEVNEEEKQSAEGATEEKN